MSEHTPKPWTLQKSSQGALILCRPGITQDFLQIHPEADAYLIAAAPDLLSALEDYVALDESTPGAEAEPVFAQARAAIDKAKGEDH